MEAQPVATGEADAPETQGVDQHRPEGDLVAAQGVGAVNRVGGADRQVQVALDPARLQGLGITAAEVSRQLRQVQMESAGGRVDLGPGEQPVRTLATVGTADELRALPIVLPDGRSVRLDQVARVTDSVAEPRAAALLNGQKVVGFEVARSRGASEVQVGTAVRAALAELRAAHPDLTFTEAFDFVTPKGNQTITFGDPGAQNFGTTPTLWATATSTLTPTFSSSTTGVCTITSGGALTFVTAGSCTIAADQAGNSVWNAAPTVTRSFTVNAVVPGAPTIGTATAGNTQATVTFTAPASTGGAPILAGGYTVTSNPLGATSTGSSSPITVTGLTNGVTYTFTVTATNSAGTGSASAASNSVTPASPQTITFADPGAQNFGTSPTLSASSSAGGGYVVTFTSATPGVCTITSGGILTFVTAGTCTINADQAGDSSFLPAPQVSRSFMVNAVVPGAPTSTVAIAGDTQASVAFVAPFNTGGTAITGYTVTVNPAHVVPVFGASSPIVVSGLTNGQAYTFTVTAENVAGTGHQY